MTMPLFARLSKAADKRSAAFVHFAEKCFPSPQMVFFPIFLLKKFYKQI